MFKNKFFYLFIILMLVAGIYAVAGAHGGNSNGDNNMMGNGNNGQMNDNWEDDDRGFNDMMGPGGMMSHGGMMGMMNMMRGNRGMMSRGGMMRGMMNRMRGRGGMMGGYGPGNNENMDYSLSALGMTEDEVQELAVDLVSRQFGSDYQISDIFVFDNSPYYISVLEKNSEQGAFELLFDPYRKIIYPEYGPNMMWNTEYGMSNMMGWGIPSEENRLSRQQAQEIAEKFAQANGFTVEDEGHQFHGYYTFHTGDNNNTTGMMSVNAYTGQTWYHNWHGTLAAIIEVEGHEE